MKKGYKVAIESETIANTNFRKVLYSGEHSQLVLMSLKVGEEIGIEVHDDTDQFFRFESGSGTVMVNDTEYSVIDGDAVVVPAGAQHNVINTSETESLTLYTIYSPAHHKDGIVQVTKEEALTAENDGSDEFEGATE